MIPGEVITTDGEIELNPGRETLTLRVANTGDRPVQVGSHFHFAETNSGLDFDRGAALGFRLNIASGTAIRFEPGQERDVELVLCELRGLAQESVEFLGVERQDFRLYQWRQSYHREFRYLL